MKLRNRQQGMTAIGWLIVLGIVGGLFYWMFAGRYAQV